MAISSSSGDYARSFFAQVPPTQCGRCQGSDGRNQTWKTKSSLKSSNENVSWKMNAIEVPWKKVPSPKRLAISTLRSLVAAGPTRCWCTCSHEAHRKFSFHPFVSLHFCEGKESHLHHHQQRIHGQRSDIFWMTWEEAWFIAFVFLKKKSQEGGAGRAVEGSNDPGAGVLIEMRQELAWAYMNHRYTTMSWRHGSLSRTWPASTQAAAAPKLGADTQGRSPWRGCWHEEGKVETDWCRALTDLTE